MAHADHDFSPVVNPTHLQSLLDALCRPGAASLLPESSDGQPLPVVVEPQPGPSLLLELAAGHELAAELINGMPFRLLGQHQQGLLRTPPLTLRDGQEREGRLQGRCDYPAGLELMQRRDNFRARLRLGMTVEVSLQALGSDATLQGRLRDLSLTGCRVECRPIAGVTDSLDDNPLPLTLRFPDGQQFAVEGVIRNRRVDDERRLVAFGIAFIPGTPEREQRLWYLVREIEREAARCAQAEQGARMASPLFQADGGALGRRHGREQATPMVRRLSCLAAYLELQQLALRQEGCIDSPSLSRHAELLLTLLDEDREALLFATVCLEQESPLIRHCLSVAVRLVDMVGGRGFPGELRKALAASALVHDLGKSLLPPELLAAPRLNDDQYQDVKSHVALLQARLSACEWLPPAVLSAVVGGANERLDGSGYPAGMAGDMLHELTRLTAVVDTVDAMGRPRPDRPAHDINAIYRHLLGHPQQYDERWVRRYMRHFGRWPVGSLVRYGGGELAWVQRLDGNKRPNQVQLASAPVSPGADAGRVLRQGELARLGPIMEIVMPVAG
ncbi:HD domain-containing phosphohydrolase [Zobellella maritima]|uniref:HD domain-containing phosphohydrolase n=1 Tax=Zobellella maritima TaxID=2059725 RepID=UPI000E309C9A|nr:HD domain-containing phosphohydrolase [Zobellella maritima]